MRTSAFVQHYHLKVAVSTLCQLLQINNWTASSKFYRLIVGEVEPTVSFSVFEKCHLIMTRKGAWREALGE